MRLQPFGILCTVLIQVSGSAFAQPSNNARSDGLPYHADLDALAAAPVPEQRTDLDTSKLASAHRERAASMQERTNGLWQSWLVSICEGCGPQVPSYKARDLEMKRAAVPRETVPVTRHAVGIANAPSAKRTTVASNYADLSPEGIERIRRPTRP